MHVWNLWGSVPPTRLRTTGLRGTCVYPLTESAVSCMASFPSETSSTWAREIPVLFDLDKLATPTPYLCVSASEARPGRPYTLLFIWSSPGPYYTILLH